MFTMINMSTITQINQQTVIGLEESQLVGQKPLRYFVQEAPRVEPTSMTEFGNLRSVGNCCSSVPQPSRLNELPATFELPVSHGYLASENSDRRKPDISSDLRFGGNVRCLKSMQQVTEKTYGRYKFIEPVLGSSSGHVVLKDLEFGIGNSGVSTPVPNFKGVGNNPIFDNQIGSSTRNRLIENREL
tara:strand:+ start:562 stop:1122 length:561 start_codon:yes stop_codon:yes gene_type:complete